MILKSLESTADLVMLNPPFTCRGGTRFRVDHQGMVFQCSLAAAFVLTAIQYLAPNGTLIALLPASFLRSEKDEHVLRYLGCISHWEEKLRLEAGTFPECAARTALLALTLHEGPRVAVSPPSSNTRLRPNAPRVKLVRGHIPMNSLVAKEIGKGQLATLSRFVHTTNISEGMAHPVLRFLPNVGRRVVGPAVLLPRVGKPTQSKLALFTSPRSISLSDCVIAMECDNLRRAEALLADLRKHWRTLSAAYSGTGAPYITVRALATLLHGIGYRVDTPVDKKIGQRASSADKVAPAQSSGESVVA